MSRGKFLVTLSRQTLATKPDTSTPHPVSLIETDDGLDSLFTPARASTPNPAKSASSCIPSELQSINSSCSLRSYQCAPSGSILIPDNGAPHGHPQTVFSAVQAHTHESSSRHAKLLTSSLFTVPRNAVPYIASF